MFKKLSFWFFTVLSAAGYVTILFSFVTFNIMGGMRLDNLAINTNLILLALIILPTIFLFLAIKLRRIIRVEEDRKELENKSPYSTVIQPAKTKFGFPGLKA